MTGPDPVGDMVLLHGVGLDHRMWRRCRDALQRRYRVTAPDLLGHGAARPAPPGTTLADLGDDIAERMPRQAHVVGFSLGALVAQWLACFRPELVSRLTLVSSVCHRSEEERGRAFARLTTARESLAATADLAVDRWFSPQWKAREPELVDEVHRTLAGNDLDSYLSCYQVFATADEPLWPLLASIAAPTLAITGEHDPGSTPDMTRRLAESIPVAEAVIVKGARHLLPLERPDALTAAILDQEAQHVLD